MAQKGSFQLKWLMWLGVLCRQQTRFAYMANRIAVKANRLCQFHQALTMPMDLVRLVGRRLPSATVGGVLVSRDKVLLEVLLKTTGSGAIIGGVVMIAGVVLLPMTMVLLHGLSLAIVLAEVRVLDEVLVVPLVALHFIWLRRTK